jgi:hypothetical protein
MLRKDKTQSTAFRVAQIFVSGRRKYMRKVSLHPEVAENTHWHFTCFLTPTGDTDSGLRRQNQMKDREKWMELCRQASVEHDPEKLLELTAQIIRLLDEKENRLIHRATKPVGEPTPQS